MHYHFGQTAAKKKVITLDCAQQAKNQCNFDSSWLEQQQCDLQSFFSVS